MLDSSPVPTQHFPRTAVLDLTPIGGPSATGQLKANLFRPWPEHAICELSGSRDVVHRRGSDDRAPLSDGEAVAAVRDFAPDLILYRPVPEAPRLHNIAMSLLESGEIPFVVWIVDDWPRTHKKVGVPIFGPRLHDLRRLFRTSGANLAISREMSDRLGRRYAVEFDVVHNGVPRSVLDATGIVPNHAARPADGQSTTFRFGYRGAVTRRKESATIDRVADGIDLARRRSGLDIALDVATPSIFMRHLEELKHRKQMEVSPFIEDYSSYIDALRAYDAVLLAYNFARSSRKYLSLSLPNKLPELLASGRPILYVGPADLPAAHVLARSGSAVMVTSPRTSAILDGVMSVVHDSDLRVAVVGAARKLLQERFVLEEQQRAFRNVLTTASEAR